MLKKMYVLMLIAGLIFLISGCDKQTTTPETTSLPTDQNTFSSVKGGGLHQIQCSNGGVGDRIWYDLNCNGKQDAGEPSFPGVDVIIRNESGEVVANTQSGWNGLWGWGVVPGTWIIEVVPPAGYSPSPTNAPGTTPADDSNVNPSVVTVLCNAPDSTIDFGFCRTPPPGICSRTPGYWKTHANAWPVRTITIGGYTYTKSQAIFYMSQPDGDKRYTMFRHLVSAKLNVLRGTNATCISTTITLADQWMTMYAGSGLGVATTVAGSDEAWRVGEPLAMELDNYNNGLLCAPHCN